MLPETKVCTGIHSAHSTSINRPLQIRVVRISIMTLRVLLYSHDTFGMGHTKRTISLGSAILECEPEAAVLYITGSPIIQNLKLPPGMDYVKLPSVTKLGPENYIPRQLPLCFDDLLRLRTHLIRYVAMEFKPDVFIVDHAPIGMRGEILPALRYLHRSRAKIVLGLRDVLDDPASVLPVWEKQSIIDVLNKFYNLILVYGMKEFYDPMIEYGFSAELRAKTCFTGYVYRPKVVQSADNVRLRLHIPQGPFILVTVGGGEDGEDILRLTVAALRQRPLEGFSAFITTGPMCPADVQEALVGKEDEHILVSEFVEDMPSIIAASNLVITMGGYNSLCELLAYGRRGIVLPRKTPRKEQFIRASFLAKRGLITAIDPDDVTPAMLRDVLETALTEKAEQLREKRSIVKLDGALRAAEEILSLVQETST